MSAKVGPRRDRIEGSERELVCARFLQAVTDGETFAAAAWYADVGLNRIRRWRLTDSLFDEAVVAARDEGTIIAPFNDRLAEKHDPRGERTP